MRSSFRRTKDRERRDRDQGGLLWLGVPAVVAEVGDDENQHAIKVFLDEFDSTEVQDLWIPSLAEWVGEPGYGSVHMPRQDQEVLLFGIKGCGHSLFYLPRYNETYTKPEEFGDGSQGFKSDTPYKMLADLLITMASEERVDIKAPRVRLLGGESEGVVVEDGKVAFLGAQPAARQQLPTDAVDLETCKTLCNALKHLVAIKFGFAE
jgi:hypothetical protein